MKEYELLEHTADLGIRVWGDSLRNLFINSASAMYELIADTETIKPTVSFKVKVEAKDREVLLRNWLSELLSYFHTKNILFSGFKIEELSENTVLSINKGENIDCLRHKLKREIKAVTFHNLLIREEGGRFKTEIIFDI